MFSLFLFWFLNAFVWLFVYRWSLNDQDQDKKLAALLKDGVDPEEAFAKVF